MSEEPAELEFDKEAAKVYENPMVKVNWESIDDIKSAVDDSFIMLTMETNAEGPASYVQQVSEKTYKAIRVGLPFIIFAGRPGILKHLRSLGFRTFHPYIDESYDYPTIHERTEDAARLQDQYNTRFRRLTKELNRLCQLSHTELVELWEQCQPIVQHNLQILQSCDAKHIRELPIIEK